MAENGPKEITNAVVVGSLPGRTPATSQPVFPPHLYFWARDRLRDEPRLREVCEASETEAAEIADQLDRWAAEAHAGGWSTQHVGPMQSLANLIRRRGAKRRALLAPPASGAEKPDGPSC
jgi:hypothetical protein